MESRDDETPWNELFSILEKLPFLSSVQRDSAALRELVQKRRGARILVFAGTEARASELLGLFGLPKLPPRGSWHEAKLNLTSQYVALLIPDEAHDDKTSLAELKAITKDHEADVILCADSSSLSFAEIASDHFLNTPAILFFDEGGRSQPYFDGLKLIDAEHMTRRERISVIIKELPVETQLSAVRAFGAGTAVQQELASKVIKSCSTIALTVGLSPIPFSDLFLLLPLQLFLVGSIAYLAGRDFSRKAVVEYLGSLGIVGGAGAGFRLGAQQLLKLIPGAGSIISAGFASTGTFAIGTAAKTYYLNAPMQVGGGKERSGINAGNQEDRS